MNYLDIVTWLDRMRSQNPEKIRIRAIEVSDEDYEALLESVKTLNSFPAPDAEGFFLYGVEIRRRKARQDEEG